MTNRQMPVKTLPFCNFGKYEVSDVLLGQNKPKSYTCGFFGTHPQCQMFYSDNLSVHGKDPVKIVSIVNKT